MPIDPVAITGGGFLLPSEVAQKLRVSRMTVYRALQSGELFSIRVGRSYRIPAASYEAYIDTPRKSKGDPEPGE